MSGTTRTRTGFALAICTALALAGCGGEERQDADEPSGTFEVDVVSATFPKRQNLARQERLVLEVRNTGRRAVPNVAVTVDGFSERLQRADVSDPDRPIWIIDREPRGATTAYVNTWAAGRLAPGQSRRFEWRVTATKAGRHEVRWRVAAGLDGKARAVAEDGGVPEGAFDVRISRRPAQARVDPETGEVVRNSGSGDR